MSIAQALLPEWDHEIGITRKHIERVNGDKLGWAPHEKSMTLGRLASHIAEVPGWASAILEADEFDVAPPGGPEYEASDLGSVEDILSALDVGCAKAHELLDGMSDESLMSQWTFKKAGEVIMAMPKVAAFKGFALNHIIHHRGQLSVYLRLTGSTVPQTYGPSADETDM